MVSKPVLEIIAGPNGSGKSTFADILSRRRRSFNFLNADTIASGLGVPSTTSLAASVAAGKVMVRQIRECIDSSESVAFETTLSGKMWTRVIETAKDRGFEVVIYFVLVATAKLAVQRVAHRVSLGGHDIPKNVIERRFERSRTQFKEKYQFLVDRWYVLDNSADQTELVARKDEHDLEIFVPEIFEVHFG